MEIVYSVIGNIKKFSVRFFFAFVCDRALKILLYFNTCLLQVLSTFLFSQLLCLFFKVYRKHT